MHKQTLGTECCRIIHAVVHKQIYISERDYHLCEQVTFNQYESISQTEGL